VAFVANNRVVTERIDRLYDLSYVPSLTLSLLLMARDTVAMETPAASATSCKVGFFFV
jgi:hypothetical protein